MELTTEEFGQVIETLSSIPDPNDARRMPRVILHRTVVVVPEPHGDELPVRLRDISRGGIGFSHYRPMPKGARFLLRLPQEYGRVREVPCVVRHCQMTGPETFSIGAQFDAEPGEDR